MNGSEFSLSPDIEATPFKTKKKMEGIKLTFKRKSLIQHRKTNSHEAERIRPRFDADSLEAKLNALCQRKHRDNSLTPSLLPNSIHIKNKKYSTLKKDSNKRMRYNSLCETRDLLLRTINQKAYRHSKDYTRLHSIKEKIASLSSDEQRIEKALLTYKKRLMKSNVQSISTSPDNHTHLKKPIKYVNNSSDRKSMEDLVRGVEFELDKRMEKANKCNRQAREEEILKAHKDALVNLSLAIPCAEDLLKKIQNAFTRYIDYNIKKSNEKINKLEAQIEQNQLNAKHEKTKNKVPRLDLSKIHNLIEEDSACFIGETSDISYNKLSEVKQKVSKNSEESYNC
eukprot:TRINITY_DN3431_c0_g1_i7.p1 TRINITY_DN3431_c0_g1~~TRINITY_DN3431_c0_g1_i7.p1  ORF type:complete len:340 (+),score=33.57 TRINITY_DN3431_c0_g1_i7:60-1079(+)